MRAPARSLAAALAVALAAACSGGAGVRTESAAQVNERAPAVTETPTPTPPMPSPAPAPAPSELPSTTTESSLVPSSEPTDPAQPSTSTGDSLFPELGSNDLDVQSYDLRLHYDEATAAIDATVRITTLVTRPLNVIALDAGELVVDSVTVDGAPATFERTDTELLIHPAAPVSPAAPVVADITYHDTDHEVGGGYGLGVGSGWFAALDGSYVLNEPDGARRWLPSNDHPSDKATWHFELTVPAGTTAVANGRFVGQQPADGGVTWIWEQPEPMATYLVQLLTGDYAILDGGTAGDTPLTNVALRDDVDRMQPYFDATAAQIAYFETVFGPYPLQQYGLAFAASVPGLAMETQGRSMFSRDDFRGDVDPLTELFQSHELAHQWFGDAVTPADWSDLWLNESFATYGQWLWLEHSGGGVVEHEAQTALRFRQTPSEPTAKPSAANLFGFERYDGGAVVLHALRKEIGDDAFFALLQRWVADNVGTSRTTADFTSLAATVAGRDLSAFFDAWLYAPSLPPTFPA